METWVIPRDFQHGTFMIHDWDQATGEPRWTNTGGVRFDSSQFVPNCSMGMDVMIIPQTAGKIPCGAGAVDGGLRGWSVSDLHFRTRQAGKKLCS